MNSLKQTVNGENWNAVCFVYILACPVSALSSFKPEQAQFSCHLFDFVICKAILLKIMTIFHKKRLLRLTAFREEGYKKILTHS